MSIAQFRTPQAPQEKTTKQAPARPRAARKRTVVWIVAVLVIAAISAIAWQGSVQAVDLTAPRWMQTIETIATSGIVEGRTETTLGADTQGTVVDLLVQENDIVKRGQLLARVQSRGANGQVGQATAATARAQAQLRQTMAGPSPDEVGSSEARVRQAYGVVDRAKAAVDQARIGVDLADTSYREAEASFERTKANLDGASSRRALAQKTVERTRILVAEGALAGARLDDAQSALDVADAAVRDASQSVLAAESGVNAARLSKESARSALKGAESELKTAASARGGAEADLRNLRRLPRRESVEVALAQVREAEAALAAAQAVASNSEIRAPFDGTVTQIVAQKGSSVGGQGVLRLVETGRLEASADVDESNLGRLRVGLRVVLTTSADPSRTIDAHVVRVDSHVDAASGTVRIVVIPTNASSLRPGQTVDINIVVNEAARRLLVPTSAVRRKGDETVVFVADHGRAQAKAVQTGLTSGREIAVLEGLSDSDRIVRDAANLENGKRIRVRR